MPPISKNILKFLYFTRAQSRGVVALVLILLLLIILNFVLPGLVGNRFVEDESFKQDIAAFNAAPLLKDESPVWHFFPFDPNTISKDKMLELGLSEYQAGMIVKYRDAGGSFDSKEDFADIYSISDMDYQSLEPYINITIKAQEPEKISKPKRKLRPFAFDPNVADSATLGALGLADYQLANVLNYRKAGGNFRTPEDFKKLYTIDEKTFAQLENYIRLPAPDSTELLKDKPAIVREIIEINSADEQELQKVKGIGPVYAKRIVDYRERLGGFYTKLQLLEVFGIDTARYLGLVDQISIDTNRIHKLELNTSGFKDLLRHPYLEYYLVQSVFEYKDRHGHFDSVAELKQVDLVYNHLYQRISPYLYIHKNEKIN